MSHVTPNSGLRHRTRTKQTSSLQEWHDPSHPSPVQASAAFAFISASTLYAHIWYTQCKTHNGKYTEVWRMVTFWRRPRNGGGVAAARAERNTTSEDFGQTGTSDSRWPIVRPIMRYSFPLAPRGQLNPNYHWPLINVISIAPSHITSSHLAAMGLILLFFAFRKS